MLSKSKNMNDSDLCELVKRYYLPDNQYFSPETSPVCLAHSQDGDNPSPLCSHPVLMSGYSLSLSADPWHTFRVTTVQSAGHRVPPPPPPPLTGGTYRVRLAAPVCPSAARPRHHGSSAPSCRLGDWSPRPRLPPPPPGISYSRLPYSCTPPTPLLPR